MIAETKREFQIGLAMAGAISAGAYSAGVFDFLIQALEAWEQARNDPAQAPGIPNHRVGIKVIVGASAGAMTGALGAVALAGGIKPDLFANPPAKTQTIKCLLPKLYEAWVVKPCMISPVGDKDLLQTGDLDKNTLVISALNSQVLDSIAESVLALDKQGPKLPYISSELEIYLTMSNLRGVPYAVHFTGGDYGMMSHGDRAHYRVLGLGDWVSPSIFARKDQTRQIDVADLFGTGGPAKKWQDYALAAVTSGAFPIGLASRQWQSDADEYRGRNWPLADAQAVINNMSPAWPRDWLPIDPDKPPPFGYTAVDGGLINNEPFEYARFTLMRNPPIQNSRDGKLADRAVIMVDPFPEPPPFPPDGKPKGDLISVLTSLIPALRIQTQFKPSEVAVAAAEDCFSRFMVSPHRSINNADQRFAIASGLLGGFGGFLAQDFRDHDYQLGRRNCQKFLLSAFDLMPENPIVAAWPAAARAAFSHPSPTGDTNLHPIIPLLGNAEPKVELPPWPRISDDSLSALQAAIEGRVRRLASVLIAQNGPNWLLRRLMQIAFLFAKGRVFSFVRLSILSDLVRRDQIEGRPLPQWQAPPANAAPDDIRAVGAELLDPKFDFRSVIGLCRSTGLDATTIGSILTAFHAETASPFAVWPTTWTDARGNSLYALASRKPSLFRRLPVIRQICDWFAAPNVDPS